MSAVAVDLAVDQGACLINFHQSWQSHFGAAKTSEYGASTQHVFDWTLFLRNWDNTIPTLAGIILAKGEG